MVMKRDVKTCLFEFRIGEREEKNLRHALFRNEWYLVIARGVLSDAHIDEFFRSIDPRPMSNIVSFCFFLGWKLDELNKKTRLSLLMG